MEFELSYLLFGFAVGLAVLALILAKFNKEEFMICLIFAVALTISGGMANSIESSAKKNSDYEKALESYTYEAYLEDNRVIPAKVCELNDDKKICEVLEYTFKGEGSKEETIQVVVEDYWERDK